jgi:hypothetical protein
MVISILSIHGLCGGAEREIEKLRFWRQFVEKWVLPGPADNVLLLPYGCFVADCHRSISNMLQAKARDNLRLSVFADQVSIRAETIKYDLVGRASPDFEQVL